MASEVRVPTTGNAGEDAVVLECNAEVGSTVKAGDVLVVLETAKSTIEVETTVSGVVLTFPYAEGDEVPEHEVLAVIGEPGEVVETVQPTAGTPPAVSQAEPQQRTEPVTSNEVAEPQEERAPRSHVRINASPRARILAEQNGIELHSLPGTGPRGRIIIADVKQAMSAGTSQQPAHGSIPSTPSRANTDDFTVVPVRGARKVTAQRMQASLQESAQLTITRYADAQALMDYAARLKSISEADELPKIGLNALLLFATARALVRHPAANSWFAWDGIKQFSTVNLGFAVDTGQALLVPVIRSADTLTVADLASEARELISKSRSGAISLDEMEGSTFTVSNLGGLGVHWFTPVLNPPQSGILGVGATYQAHPDAAPQLPLSLTFDHRALDGAAAAALLGDISRMIETIDVLAAF